MLLLFFFSFNRYLLNGVSVWETHTKKIAPEVQQTKVIQVREETPPRSLVPVEEEQIIPLHVTHPVSGGYTPSQDSKVYVIESTTKSVTKKPPTTSYGGTFHVSKEVVPMPSPIEPTGYVFLFIFRYST